MVITQQESVTPLIVSVNAQMQRQNVQTIIRNNIRIIVLSLLLFARWFAGKGTTEISVELFLP